jgi:hypothetical protein
MHQSWVSRVNQVDVRPSTRLSSDSLRSPTALAGHVIGPALAAIQQVIALGNQSLVQLAGEQGNALRSGVMPEPMAGHADLAAATGAQHVFIEVRPRLAVACSLYRCGHRASRSRTGESHHQTLACVHMY